METDAELRERIEERYPLIAILSTSVCTATGYQLDMIANYWGLERKRLATKN